MTQNYLNVEDVPIETIFTFPKDTESVISKIECEFEMPDGTKTSIETVIENRAKAEVKYEDAVATGKTAIIGSIDRKYRDMMKIACGNFPPKARATLKVYFYQEMKVEDLSYCLRVPVGYIPKYVPEVVRILNFTSEQFQAYLNEESSDDLEFFETPVDVSQGLNPSSNLYIWNFTASVHMSGPI